MMSTMWLWSLLVLQLVARLGSTTVLPGVEEVGRRCHQCASCAGVLLSSPCPLDRPYCATIISTQNVTSSLSCSPKVESPCTLTHSAGSTHLQLTCICPTELCNAPFTQALQEHLLNFSHSMPNVTDLFSAFLNTTDYAKLPAEELYEGVTTARNASHGPQAAALKQEAPSEDDEDEGEGSGAEEPRRPPAPPADPADPSSYLPAHSGARQQLRLSTLALLLYLLTKA